MPDSHDANGQVQYGTYGMTLLDWMAGQALTGILADPGSDGEPEEFSTAAYTIASAMLTEKARREADHSPDSGKVAALEAENEAAQSEVKRLRVELHKFADSHAKLESANMELVYALMWVSKTIKTTSDHKSKVALAVILREVDAIIAKHKATQ